MSDVTKKIFEFGIIPLVKINDVKDAIPLAKSLENGGLPCAEITFRTDAAEKSIRQITKNFPQMLVGAGTVQTIEQTQRAIDAGAKFIVSPELNEKIVKYCISEDIIIFPGVCTPADIEKALSFGLNYLNFFPAEASGAIPMIKSLCSAYTNVKFIATGGINENNINDYLCYEKVIACGGSWMVNEILINEGRFDEITSLVNTAVNKMHGFELMHIGVNNENAEAALFEAKKLAKLLGMPVKEGESSTYTGTIFELMKKKHFGAYGHIGVGVNSVERVYASLIRRGYEFHEQTVTYDDKGRKTFGYLKDEFANFAIHIMKK